MEEEAPYSKFMFWFLVGLICVGFVAVTSYTYNPKVDSAGDNASYYILGKSIAEGNGYSNIHLPQGGAAKHFPPGYPFIIATAMTFGFDHFEDIKVLNYIFFAGALFFIYLIARQVLERPLWALAMTLVCAFNPIMLQYSSMMMSEIPFLFFSMAALKLFLKAEERDDKSLRSIWFWLFIVVLIFSFYIRSIAIAFLVAACVVYLRSRKLKRLVAMCTVFVVCVLPWMIRNASVEGSSYISQLFMKNPLNPSLGSMDFADWPIRVWNNVERYFTSEVPAGVLVGVRADYFSESSTIWVIVGIVIVVLTVYGLFKLPKGRSVILTYFVCTFAILFLWPDAWFGPRFILPLVPIFLIGFGSAVLRSFRSYEDRKLNRALIPLNLIGLLAFSMPAIIDLAKEAEKPYTRGMQQIMNFGNWLKENAADDAVTCIRKPALFYLFSERQAVRYRYTDKTVEQLEHLKANGVDYVIFDALGYESTPKYLVPLIKKHPFKFFNIHQYNDPEAILFEFTPQNGYEGDWKDGKKSGFGTFTWPNGNYYRGQWENDLPNGEGAIQIGDTTYAGEFGNGLRDGYGKEFTSDGTIIGEGIYAADTLKISKEQLELLEAH